MPLLTILNLSGTRVEVCAGQSLLAAVQEAGIDWMHACGAKGRCTTCRIQITAGWENLAPLTAAEHRYRAAGRLSDKERLTCQAQLPAGTAQGRVPAATQLPHMRYREEDGVS